MDEKTYHAHVISKCRHCDISQQMGVYITQDLADEDLVQLSQKPTIKDETITLLAKGIARMQLKEHDVIIMSCRCYNEFRDCQAAFEQYMFFEEMRMKTERLMRESLGDEGMQRLMDSVADAIRNGRLEPTDDFNNSKNDLPDIRRGNNSDNMPRMSNDSLRDLLGDIDFGSDSL